MKKPFRPLAALFFPAAGLAFAACSSTPENPGDSCNFDDDNCPAPLVCSKDADDNAICQIPPGGACDLAQDPDYCLDAAICVDDGTGVGVCILYIGEGGACDPANEYEVCEDGLVCDPLVAGGSACNQPVVLSGMVFDAVSTAAIEGAHVLALNELGSAVTDIAISDAAGNYDLQVPVPRLEDGTPDPDATFTLRASAQDYATFPGGIRTALPIQASLAADDGTNWVIDAAITDVALLPLPAAQQGLPSISGSVLAGVDSAGVLVVAEDGTNPGITAISDKSGAYTIFNVPAGSYTVAGYAAGVQLVPESASVTTADVLGVDLGESEDALATVSGQVQIVNAPGGSLTSVVLVVESTFNDTFVRGEVPRGLRAPPSGPPNVSGSFSIAGVPAGQYVVLAAFENDGLVRDPDPNIAGTQIVHLTVPAPGSAITIPDSFKITEALEILGPGALDPEPVTAAPLFEWVDDSSEEFYTVDVYDAFGTQVWTTQIPGVSGGNASVQYAGPLDPGMYYQFRATSWKQSGGQPPGPISMTEDLKGVFYVQ